MHLCGTVRIIALTVKELTKSLLRFCGREEPLYFPSAWDFLAPACTPDVLAWRGHVLAL